MSLSIHYKLDVIPKMMDCLYAKCIPIVTDCMLAELEKLGPKYRLALRIAKDPRFERLRCDHKGTYADDCLVERAMKHRIYIVATNDRDLKRRIRCVLSFIGWVRIAVLTFAQQNPRCPDYECCAREICH